MRKPRHLSSEERALWNRVADRTKPLEMERTTRFPTPAIEPSKKVKAQRSIEKFGFEPQPTRHVTTTDTPPARRGSLSISPVQMDHKSYTNMKRGKLKPEARLDLHGLVLAEAHPELIRFVSKSQALGHRLILVITGKGKGRDDIGVAYKPLGVLRQQVPHWLALPPLKNLVLQVSPAHKRHGGEGAYYVYLRRNR